MIGFICTNCKYRFKARFQDKCPYCGDKMVEKEKSADELVQEVENLLGE